MLSLYIGVYKAVYDYAAQAEEELTILADDLLYLLEKSTVDDWWKCKKRVLPTGDEEVEEPEGLVPSTYIEMAPVVKSATALYDYTKQTEEELSFKEGDLFNLYDLNDPDWLLAGDSNGQSFGFIPSNYIKLDGQDADTALPTPPPPVEKDWPQSSSQLFMPPPAHPSLKANPDPAALNNQSATRGTFQEHTGREEEEEEEEEAPPMPSRPTISTKKSQTSLRTVLNDTYDGPSARASSSSNTDTTTTKHGYDGNFFNWYIDEIEGHRKRPVVLLVGQSLLILKPNTESTKRFKTASSIDHQWRIRDLKSYSTEKKHLFLELRNPLVSLELHTGSKDVADAILSVISEIKGADSGRGMTEIARAVRVAPKKITRKRGRLLYDFQAQGDDELEGKMDDEVDILDDTRSSAWWLCVNVESGQRGVIPSAYLEILDDKSSSRGDSTRLESSRGRVVQPKSKRHGREDRDRIRETDRVQRDKKKRSAGDSDKEMPNFHRVRTWIDSSGTFKVEAEFLGCVDGKIHLHKTNGVKIAVGATKLSVEDLEYVEKITGTSLQNFKDEVNRTSLKPALTRGTSGVSSKTQAVNYAPPPKPARQGTKPGDEEYDWFDFFLGCGVDIGNCQRYSLNFNREQMAENILADISPSLLRILGLREGDILRVMKFLDNKFDRTSGDESLSAENGGSMFTEASGALKNNGTATDVSRVHAGALPSSSAKSEPTAPMPAFEDDAWAMKPAARSTEDLSKPAPTPQYTGSLLDLVNIKPLEPVKTQSTLNKAATSSNQPQTFSAQPLASQNTQQQSTLGPQRTGLVPVATGGLIPIQPTGFMPITSQPTGFIPIQTTALPPQLTFGLIPLQTGPNTFTGQATGGNAPPPTLFNSAPLIIPLQTGNVTMPQTSFGQALTMPQTSFGQVLTTPLVPVQRTGGLVPVQRTGGQPPFQPQYTLNNQPITSFQLHLTGGTMPQFGQQQQQPLQQPTGFQSSFAQNLTAGNMQPINSLTGGGGQTFGGSGMPPAPSFASSVPAQPLNNFGQQFGGGFNQPPQQQMNALTNMFQNTGISQPATSFGQFNQQPQQQQFFNSAGQQPAFPSFGQLQQQQPAPQFEGFGVPALQLQPTGAGFGNAPAPMLPQQTGKRANLSNATAANPFGF